MAIKHTISNLEEVDEAFRSHYKPADVADPAKGFVLDVDGAPQPEDVGGLKRALERLRIEKAEAIELAKKAGGSTEELESLRKSHDSIVKELKGKIEQTEAQARASFHDKTVTDLANKLGGKNAHLWAPHIRSRLVIEAPDGTNLVRVLGKDGKASALSLEDLVSEFKADELFAPILQMGQASGSGTPGGGSSNGGAGGGTGKVGNFTELPANPTSAQLLDWLAKNSTPGFKPVV